MRLAAAEPIEAGASDREVARRFRVTRMPANPVAAGVSCWWSAGAGLLDGFLASTGLDFTPFCNPHD